jgi:hypothetical protein
MSVWRPFDMPSLRRASPIYLSLALMLTFLHARTVDLKFGPRRSAFHRGIMQGTFNSPYQYRILSPALAEAGGWIVEKTLGVPEGDRPITREVAYITQRLVATFLLFVFFHLFLLTWFSSELALAGTAILAALHPLSYLNYYFQPDSPLNILFLTIGAWLIVQHRSMPWLLALTLIGSFNRETFGMIVALYLACHGLNRKSLKHASWLLLTWAAVLLILRAMFGFRPSFPADEAPLANMHYLHWPLVLFSLMWLIPFIHYKRLPPFLRRGLVLFVPPLVMANFAFGEVQETRLFLDLAIVLIPATLYGLFGPTGRDAGPEGCPP